MFTKPTISQTGTTGRQLGTWLVLLLSSLIVSPALAAGTVFVDCAAASSLEQGTELEPYRAIRDGVAALPEEGGTVRVAAGICPESVRIQRKSGISIVANGTRLDHPDPGFKITDSSLIVIRGFWIESGQGFEIRSSSDVALEDNVLFEVSATLGGAVYAARSRIRFEGNAVINGRGGQRGGAGYFFDSDVAVLGNAVIRCTAWNSAGGFYVSNSGETPREVTIAGNYFYRNTADFSGAIDIRGSLYSGVTIRNNIIVRSGPDFKGGGSIRISLADRSQVLVEHNTIFDPFVPGFVPTVAVYTTGGEVHLRNNVFSDQPSEHVTHYSIFNTEALVSAEYNNHHNLSFAGVLPDSNSFDADPRFTGLFQLTEGSPSLDAGDPSLRDADGSRADQGAYGGPRPFDALGPWFRIAGTAAQARPDS